MLSFCLNIQFAILEQQKKAKVFSECLRNEWLELELIVAKIKLKWNSIITTQTPSTFWEQHVWRVCERQMVKGLKLIGLGIDKIHTVSANVALLLTVSTSLPFFITLDCPFFLPNHLFMTLDCPFFTKPFFFHYIRLSFLPNPQNIDLRDDWPWSSTLDSPYILLFLPVFYLFGTVCCLLFY